MATCTQLYIDTLGGLDLDGSTDKNLPYFVVENLATLVPTANYRIIKRTVICLFLPFSFYSTMYERELIQQSIGLQSKYKVGLQRVACHTRKCGL